MKDKILEIIKRYFEEATFVDHSGNRYVFDLPIDVMLDNKTLVTADKIRLHNLKQTLVKALDCRIASVVYLFAIGLWVDVKEV